MDSIITEEEFEHEVRNIEKRCQKKIIGYIEVITFCRRLLEEYRKKIRGNGFRDTDSEVHFFRHQKQIPQTHLIFYGYLQAFDLENQKIAEPFEKKNIDCELEKLNLFFRTHLEFIRYLDLDENYLDKYYFTRKYNDKIFFGEREYYRDPEFSTSHDLLLSQIRANQLYLSFLQQRLDGTVKLKPLSSGKGKLQWTSSKVALTELIYALHHSGAINNGNVSLKEMVHDMENHFGVELGDYHHTFLRLRERAEPVKFIDKLRKGLSERMEELDS